MSKANSANPHPDHDTATGMKKNCRPKFELTFHVKMISLLSAVTNPDRINCTLVALTSGSPPVRSTQCCDVNVHAAHAEAGIKLCLVGECAWVPRTSCGEDVVRGDSRLVGDRHHRRTALLLTPHGMKETNEPVRLLGEKASCLPAS